MNDFDRLKVNYTKVVEHINELKAEHGSHIGDQSLLLDLYGLYKINSTDGGWYQDCNVARSMNPATIIKNRKWQEESIKYKPADETQDQQAKMCVMREYMKIYITLLEEKKLTSVLSSNIIKELNSSTNDSGTVLQPKLFAAESSVITEDSTVTKPKQISFVLPPEEAKMADVAQTIKMLRLEQ